MLPELHFDSATTECDSRNNSEIIPGASIGRGSLGRSRLIHFLFPYRHGNRPYDPSRHMSDNGIQKRWHELRDAAGMPWLTGHVLRYQCITKMAEGGIDRVTAKRIAGHVTDKMWDKYSQVRMDFVRDKLTEAFRSSSSAPGSISSGRLSGQPSSRLKLVKPVEGCSIRCARTRGIRTSSGQRHSAPGRPRSRSA
jgi:hypothetical protein